MVLKRAGALSIGRGIQPSGPNRIGRSASLRGRSSAGTNNVIAANGTVTPGSLSGAVTVPFTFFSEHHTSPQGPVSNIKTVDVGWYYNDNGTTMAEANVGGTYTIKRYIYYPAGNTFTPMTFGGQATGTVADGGQLVSDPTPNLTLPPGTKFIIATTVTAVSGAGAVPLAALPGTAGTSSPQSLGMTAGSGSGDFSATGPFTASAATTDIFRPAAILGTVGVANAKAMVLVGDSITAIGQGDAQGLGLNGGSGPLQRTIDPICAYARIGRQAIAAKDIAASNTKLQALIAALGTYSHVGIFLGTNDFNTRYSRTAAQCLTDCGTIMNLFTNTGVTKWQATVGGNATSTDGFRSAGNQTADATHLAQVPTFNPAVRAIPAYLNGGFCYDLSAYAVPVTDNCKWRTPYVMTADGTHPNTYAATWIANQARSLFGGSYAAEPETTAFFTACVANGVPSYPSQGWLDNYNSVILCGKLNGWWSKLSVFRRYDSYDRGVAKQNMKRNGDHATEVATVGWTTKVGFLTGGTGKLASTYNPSTAVDGLATQNSMSLAIGIATNEAISNGATDISCWNGTGSSFFTSRNTSNVAQGRINCAGNQATGATITDSTGRWLMSRTGATTTDIYKSSSTSLVTNANASIAVASATEEVGGLGTNYTNKTIVYSGIGAGLTSVQENTFDWDMASFGQIAATL